MENQENLPEEESILTLVNSDGEEERFEYIATVNYQENEYLILLPVEDDTQIVILQVEPIDEENESYVSVADDATLEAVYALFKEQYKDVFTFED